jgi:succinate-semialdehyde dehydrogenase/glutarate-semialdehyde dehydrogenase
VQNTVKLSQHVAAPGGIYIDGAWTAPDGSALVVRDPGTGEEVARLPAGGAAEARAAIAAAQRAFGPWSALSAEERGAPLRRAHALVLERADELARALTLEQGKPLAEARGEVLWGAEFLLWYAEEIRRPHGELVPGNGPGQRLLVRRRPRGVVACVTPWNFPSSMILRKVAPAVAAGNTVVLKPAEQTPLSAALLFDVFDAAGFPPGVVNLVCAQDPRPIGDVFCRTPDVRQISFTGSAEVGRRLLRDAADQVKKVTLELGGNAPFVIFADADLDLAVDKLIACKFQNAGQSCIAANRIFVERTVAEEVTSRLADRARGLRVGHGLDDGVQIGPLIDGAAVEKATRHVADAVDRGAELLYGGAAGDGLDPGRYVLPTVLAGVADDALVGREETFGPVMPISAFDAEEDAVRRANASAYGLAAYLFTRDLGRAVRVGEALDYGMVGINDGALGWVQVPFGGIKASGDGREGGRHGLDEYLDVQYLSVNF